MSQESLCYPIPPLEGGDPVPQEPYPEQRAPYADPLQEEPAQPLDVFNSDELADCRFKRVDYLVEGLLKPGLTVLAGSPKIGKSWLILQLCMQVAKGEPFWGLTTRRGTALYIALEDSEERLQRRVATITDEPSEHLYFALNCSYLGDELERELGAFVRQHPDTRIIVIDTFQKIRSPRQQMSYANDYAETSRLKSIADALGICILLVHHTRKMTDSDRVNEISGTNGIAGCADTLLVLTKEKRSSRKAILTCTGRDIEDQEVELTLDPRTCLWRTLKPLSSEGEKGSFPDELATLVCYMRRNTSYEGGNTQFARLLSDYCGREISARYLKQMMNQWRFELEDFGVSFGNFKSNAERRLMVVYSAHQDQSLQPADQG